MRTTSEFRKNTIQKQIKYISSKEIEKELTSKKLKADKFIRRINEVIYDNRYTLLSERNKLIKKDVYGNINYDEWFRLYENIREVEVFIAAIIFGNKQWAVGLPYFFLKFF